MTNEMMGNNLQTKKTVAVHAQLRLYNILIWTLYALDVPMYKTLQRFT